MAVAVVMRWCAVRMAVAVVMCVMLSLASGELKDRVHHQEPLSDLDHDDRNHEFDHEAFLGHHEAKSFDELAPEEAKRRLSIMVDKLDGDGDGFVTGDELRTWIMAAQRNQLIDSLEEQWAELNLDNDSSITWSEYQNVTLTAYLANPGAGSKDNYTSLMQREERRWRAADRDGDLKADREEFAAFIHPDEYPHMMDVVVMEVLEELDKNNDGFVDMDEFIGDVYVPVDGEDEPDWVDAERQQFRASRDRDGDGRLDKQEVRVWIFPEDADYVGDEVQHLIEQADANQDGKLSKSEMVEKHDVFVGSQDIGDALMQHDEF